MVRWTFFIGLMSSAGDHFYLRKKKLSLKSYQFTGLSWANLLVIRGWIGQCILCCNLEWGCEYFWYFLFFDWELYTMHFDQIYPSHNLSQIYAFLPTHPFVLSYLFFYLSHLKNSWSPVCVYQLLWDVQLWSVVNTLDDTLLKKNDSPSLPEVIKWQ